MRKRLVLAVISIASSLVTYAQCDTIYFQNGNKICCNVSKVNADDIEYSYEGESLINVENKTNIERIVFKSGREQSFNLSQKVAKKEEKHAEFWGIELGTKVGKFVKSLEEKGAKLIEYQGNEEVKMESPFMSFKDAYIYIHYTKDGDVYLVDVVQKMSFTGGGKETKGIVEELNNKYKLVKEGAKPWVSGIYRWQWIGENLIINFYRKSGYSRPHLQFFEPSSESIVKESDD